MSTSDKQVDIKIFAAGAVLWRRSTADPIDVEVALVHRGRYDDWTFPKGKVEPGESAVAAAVREVKEETGFGCRLGRSLDKVVYTIPGTKKLKRVEYWAAEAVSGAFEMNSEVDELQWIRPEDATAVLTYPIDRKVLRRFRSAPAQTETVLLVRHGRAGRKSRYKRPDPTRPLDRLGREQSHALTGLLLAFGASGLHAADRVRCVQTITPLAEALGVAIVPEPLLSERGYAGDTTSARERAKKIAALGGVQVICSQGEVIPDLMKWWAELDAITLPANRNRKGSVWVLSLVGGRLVAADHIASPLPLVLR